MRLKTCCFYCYKGDPLDDICWVREEIHSWIFDNLCAKWDRIRRKPLKLLTMFTGYHATVTLVRQSLHMAGVGSTDEELLAGMLE